MEPECKVIDLFSHPKARPVSRERAKPAPGHVPLPGHLPDMGNAPVIDLFATKASDARHFGRIQEILAVRIAKDRLFVELYVNGPPLPESYLRSLTLAVDDAPSGANLRVPIEAVKTEGHYAVMRSVPLRGALRGAGELHPGALVRVLSAGGRMIQNMIHPLLQAKP